MIAYQKRQLPSTDVGDPGDLPTELQGLEDISLADLIWTDAALGYHGFGYFPVEVDDPVIIPTAITNFQTARELIENGDLPGTQALIDGSGNEPLKAYFARETVFERDNTHVNALRVLLSMTEEQMDDFFLAASAW